MKKQRKGITLIALVITIIILLILAAITINLTVGQRGIITRAQEAGKNYQEAAKREDEELTNLWAEAENIIKGNGGGTTPTPPDGGDDKDPITPTEPEPSEEVRALKAGDYIKYDTGVEGIGVITCRVLYPVDSEYGLQIISNKNVGDSITLGGSTWEEGKASYNGAVRTLNGEAEKYVNTSYAYDGRCVGSNPTVENGRFIYKNMVLVSGSMQDPSDTFVVPEDWNVPAEYRGWDSGCFRSENNFAGKDRGATIDALCMNTGEYYWYASVVASTSKLPVGFSIEYCQSNGKYTGITLCSFNAGPSAFVLYGSSGDLAKTCGVRPCLLLKAGDIKITSGDGKSETTAYTLGI